MNLKTKFASAAVASIFALSMGTAAFAQDITQNVTGGNITYTLTDGTMESITYDYTETEEYVTTGSLTLTVDDARGTSVGWDVSISSTSFFYSGSHPGGADNDIAADQFRVIPGDPVSSQDMVGVEKGMSGTLNSSVKVIEAASGSGSGVYTQELGVELTVPADAPAGEYNATLTVTTIASPGGTTPAE